MTDYERELRRIEKELAELDAAASGSARPNTEEITRRTYQVYRRAALSGHPGGFAEAEATVIDALRLTGGWPDLYLLRANLDLKFHRLAEVKCALQMAPGLAQSPQGQVLLADVAFQEGRYRESKTACEALIARERTWDGLARLAYWESKFGDVDAADALYAEAADEITAKDMRSFAWVELQRGLLDLRRGLYPQAAQHYENADRAYSGYWLTADHKAELLGAEGLFTEAAAIYETMLQTVPRPELQQALGELYAAMNCHAQADRRFDRALEGFLESAEGGGVQYFHHLVDFYSDVRINGSEAVRWGARDFELRPNFATEGALAWAYYCDGKYPEAKRHMDHALSSGPRDAHLFAKAARIYDASGDEREATRYLQLAGCLNPDHHRFHVHRS